jgi:hypothetical protein
MNDVIARLKGSKSKGRDGAQQRGLEAGRTWARRHAEVEELRRLERWTSSTDDWAEELTRDDHVAFGPHHGLVETIRGEPCSRPDVDEFWERGTGQDLTRGDVDKPSFLEGFVDGALAVWGQVKDQV